MKLKKGFVRNFLATVKINTKIEFHIKSYELDMSNVGDKPMIMIGLGTGIAPFRAFIQEREWAANSLNVKPSMLFFGARYKKSEYLYGNEFDNYQNKGIVNLCLAFSRDQKQKIYIQDKIKHNIIFIKNTC